MSAIRYVAPFLMAILALVHGAGAEEENPECADQFATKPSVSLQGQSQDFDKFPPPYKFEFTDGRGRASGEYNEEAYTVRLSGEAPFRGFIIQARLATQQRFIIGHLTAGQFVEESRWSLQGVRFQQCPSSVNSSITNSAENEKYAVEAQWLAAKKEGPVQFVVSVFQNEDTYWTLWQPRSGFVTPSKSANFPEQRSSGQESEAPSAITTSESSADSDDTPASPSDTVGEEKRVLLAEDELETKVLATSVPLRRFNILGTNGRFSIRVEDVKFPRPDENGAFPEPPVFNATRREGNNGVEEEEGTTAPSLPLCETNVCKNNGVCRGDSKADEYVCECTEEWAGQDCEEKNYCRKHKCENGACLSHNETGTYSCQCQLQWAGAYCERPCPSYVCLNGGTCTIDKDNQFACICPKGWAGKKCETDIDDCASSGCLHGTCVDKVNDFECSCSPGYMGDRCHRPCQDIYKSCDFWGEQDRCESMRPATRFFDINCAVTCGQCEFDNSTVSPNLPLPPILEPFDFLLGRWVLNATRPYRFPLNFVTTEDGYTEVLEILPTDILMFGTPAINFSARAYHPHDPDDQQITVGFMTLGPDTKPLKVSMMHTGNDGMTIIEEGELVDNKMSLQMVYIALSPGVQNLAPLQAKRVFSMKGQYLQESVERHGPNGEKDYFTKYFTREYRYIY